MYAYLLNKTLIEFHILAFSSSVEGRILNFVGFLTVYLMAVIGNIIIVTLVSLFCHLQTTMYLFLCNLAILDILYVTTTLPRLLYISYTGDNTTSYPACITQLYLFMFLADTESFLLTSMAFDRYIAICYPLHYSMIMIKSTCALLAVPAWVMGAVNGLILTLFVVTGLAFCGLNEINNFFCDLKALIFISCTDTSFLRHFIFVEGACIGAIPLLLILTSYSCIFSTIFKIKTSVGRLKAFLSCSSHLTIVILYYGSAFCLYMTFSQELDKYFAVLFVTIVPVCNPLVYSLRNKDILLAMRQVVFWNKVLPTKR